MSAQMRAKTIDVALAVALAPEPIGPICLREGYGTDPRISVAPIATTKGARDDNSPGA